MQARWSKPTAVAVLLTLLSACGGSTSDSTHASAGPEVTVPTATVAKTKVEEVYDAVGTVRSKTETTISSKIVGHIVAVNVREGDRVNKGDPLAEIDARDAEAQVRKARGGLEEAQNARREAEDAIRAAEAARTAAEADLELAKATHDRYQGLLKEGAVSRQSYDEASARYRGATAQLQQATDMLSSLRARREQAQAKIEQAQADVTNAQTGLTYARLDAPMTGLVVMKNVEVGDMASPGIPLFRLEDPSHYRVEVTVDEDRVGDVHPDQQVSVTIDALATEPLPAKVAEIVPTADAASRSFTVKLDLPSHAGLRSGMYGKAHFPVGSEEILAVPKTALVERGQLTGVYAVDDEGAVHMRLVTLGKTYDERVEVLSGLSEGERIVTGDVAQLAEGQKVRLQTAGNEAGR